MNIVAAIYFFLKLLIVWFTIVAAQKYDMALEEAELVKNTQAPKELGSVDC